MISKNSDGGWSRRLLCWTGVFLLCLVTIACQRVSLGGSAGQTIRVGYGNFPPYMIFRADGSPGGFVVEVVKDAVRRQGMEVEWVRVLGPPDEELRDNKIDVYAFLVITPERQQFLAFSEPWWENKLVLLSRHDRALDNVQATVGKRIGVVSSSFAKKRMEQIMPGAIAVPDRRYQKLVAPVCLGELDGAILDVRLATALRVVEACVNVDLHMTWIPPLNTLYGVGTRKEMAATGRRIFEGILASMQDGEMTRIGEEYGVDASNNQRLVERLRSSEWQMMVAAGVALALLLVLVVVMVQSRRIQKARWQAEEAQKRAEQTLAARGRFVATISHEIRTPLNGLLGIAGLLQRTELDAEQADYAKTIQVSGHSLLAIVNDLLDYSKLDAEQVKLKREAVRLRALLDETRALYAGLASEKGLGLRVVVKEGVPEMLDLDPLRLRQMLSNLLGNAMKFTERGDVGIEAAWEGGWLWIGVRDTGIGVAVEQHQRIFEAFAQADESTTRVYGGTGLGLSVCQQLARLMGGEMGLESEAGKGSCFWLKIPAAELSAPVCAPASGPGVEAAAREEEVGLGLKLLVAEDNRINQKVIEAQLKRLGCSCRLVSDGVELLQVAHGEKFDLILTDCHMPRMDGLEAVQKLRASGGAMAEVPVIVVSASTMEEDQEKWKAARIQGQLAKPLEAEALAAALKQYAGVPGAKV
jgi:signal transduction histidine kinase/ActR/RegA family two-component response regulator